MLHKKKWVALTLIIMLAMGMLAGCSPVEKDYYNLLTAASNQKVYEQSGSIEFNLSKFAVNDLNQDEKLDLELAQKICNQYRLDYSGKNDMDQNVAQCDYIIINKITGEKSPFLSMVYKDNVFYVKVDDMVSFLKKLENADLNEKLDRIFGEAEYVTISDQEFNSIMPPNSMKGSLFESSSQILSMYTRFFDGLINQVYNNYQGNMITRKNGTYTFTLKTADMIDKFRPLAVYTINHSDKLAAFLKTFISGLNEQESAYLSLTPEMKGKALVGIDQMASDLKQNRSQYIKVIDSIPDSTSDELVKVLNDTSITATIKRNDQAYDSSFKLHFHLTPSTEEEVAFTLNAEGTVLPCDTVQVTVPTGKAITFEEVRNRLPLEMNIDIDNGSYSLNQGFTYNQEDIDVQITDNQTYLPLRKIGEALGEKVNWDQTSKQAYIEKNGQRFVMTGIIVDNHVYVKCRDFERLGYKINWDAASQTVTINK